MGSERGRAMTFKTSLRRNIERPVKVTLRKLGIDISWISEKWTIDLWNEDREFNKLAKQVEGYTAVVRVRLFMLYQLANMAISLDGNVAEAGVYRGGSAKLLAKVFERNREKTLFLFDTFSGMPETDPLKDIHKKGDFSNTSLQSVQKFLADCRNVIIHEGLFSDTFGNVTDETFCFAHIDCDIYQSVKECCEFFYPKMTPGGVMVFDDYGFISCPGAKEAVDEYFLGKPENPIYLPTGQCVVIKRGSTSRR